MFFKRKNKFIKSKSKLALVVIVVIASFLAAFIGQIAINNLSNKPALISDESFIIRQSPDRHTLLQRAVEEIFSSEVSSFVEVYSSIQGMVLAGSGIILTNDGWVVATAHGAEANYNTWKYIRLDSGELISVLKFVKDPSSPLVFLQIDSDSLTPATLGNSIPDNLLEEYILTSYRGEMKEASFISRQLISDTYLHSDLVNKYAVLDGGFAGDGVYDENSELIGFVVANSEGQASAIDSNYIRQALEDILRNDEIISASLGVLYIDLSEHAVASEVADGVYAGALITNKMNIQALNVLQATSPAYKAGVRLNDLIVSVNGDVIDDHQTLSDYIQKYEPGDSVRLGIMRGGQPLSLDAILE